MPRWVLLLAVAIVAWLCLTVLGGMLVGRLLGAVERRRAAHGPEREEHVPATAALRARSRRSA